MTLTHAQKIIAVITAIIGGISALYLFMAERNHAPKLEIKFDISCYPFNTDSKLIYAKLNIKNTGKVDLWPTDGQITLHQISPQRPREKPDVNHFNTLEPSSEELLWPQIGNRSWTWNNKKQFMLEPGESEQLEVDFLILNGIDLLRIYGFINNPTTEKLGWDTNHTFSVKLLCDTKTSDYGVNH